MRGNRHLYRKHEQQHGRQDDFRCKGAPVHAPKARPRPVASQ
jgi:hypothetical protein